MQVEVLFFSRLRQYPLPYRFTDDELELPDRSCQPALEKNTDCRMKEYVEKGYAHRAISADLDTADPRRIWFLPLGAVTNPNKPGKVRLVWDAAAKVSGVSLNNVLLKALDQLTLLPAVLIRSFAVRADIEQMLHRVGVRPDDRKSALSVK